MTIPIAYAIVLAIGYCAMVFVSAKDLIKWFKTTKDEIGSPPNLISWIGVVAMITISSMLLLPEWRALIRDLKGNKQ